jgi:transcription-repair coupling factor (superfamily II helicase)
MRENYGELPHEVVNLIKIARFKGYCNHFNVVKAEINKKNSRLIFPDLDSLKKDGIMDCLQQYKGKAILAFDENPYIFFVNPTQELESTFDLMIEFLKKALKE